jgi:hypothetical protein
MSRIVAPKESAADGYGRRIRTSGFLPEAGNAGFPINAAYSAFSLILC